MNRKKILLVDDAKTVVMMERMILNQPDYELLVAHDGEEAIEVALAEQPDLILLDIVMPKLTGVDVCRRLRAEPQTKATPIIMVTTRSESDVVQSALEAGCSGYVTKPLDPILLQRKVRELLAAAESAGEKT